jgi:hypothetical protein
MNWAVAMKETSEHAVARLVSVGMKRRRQGIRLAFVSVISHGSQRATEVRDVCDVEVL